ncbi:MAG: adenylate/guanylate cyclase domain-containing protein [Deltaproteobacteria bacterium]
MADLVLWFMIGIGIALFYILHLGAPLLTGLKILLGSSAFGLFGGMLCYLSMESRLIEHLQLVAGGASVAPEKLFSVSKKMLFFMVTVLGSMTAAILLMVFMDINYLLGHGASPDSTVYLGIFREVLFAFAVLIFLSLSILGRFSRNLKAVIALQLRVMDEITRGNYQVRTPVVSNDEFGLIAGKTNDMISGLKERDFCRMSFGKYVSPEVSQMILEGTLSLEGEVREVTILFCDLRGYTTFVEGRDPKDVVRFLNDYFTEMERAVKNNEGIILQYIGDEIEAVFGAPMDLPEHPDRAVMAALDMRARLKDLNRKRRDEGKDPIYHGIGIHTGTVLAGSVGSPERLTYAMVGDTVNSASRIQDLNKTYDTDILVSESTKNRLQDKRIVLSSLGKASLRGKKKDIELFQI